MTQLLEPSAPDAEWPRYSKAAFPPYRFIPGRSPHPRRHPQGHAYGTTEPTPPPPDPAMWRENDLYLHGIDLYNFAYWWECHEALEALWHAAGHASPTGQFLQGIIQVAAANLKKFTGLEGTPLKLAKEGLARHAGLPSPYMGVDLVAFAKDAVAWHEGRTDKPAMIRLGT
jgi:hypothetical protein